MHCGSITDSRWRQVPPHPTPTPTPTIPVTIKEVYGGFIVVVVAIWRWKGDQGGRIWVGWGDFGFMGMGVDTIVMNDSVLVVGVKGGDISYIGYVSSISRCVSLWHPHTVRRLHISKTWYNYWRWRRATNGLMFVCSNTKIDIEQKTLKGDLCLRNKKKKTKG